MDEDTIGILTYIDRDEKSPEDCQFVIGITEVCETREELLEQASDLTLEYLTHHHGEDWRIVLDDHMIMIKLDILRPGLVTEDSFLSWQQAKLVDDTVIFEPNGM